MDDNNEDYITKLMRQKKIDNEILHEMQETRAQRILNVLNHNQNTALNSRLAEALHEITEKVSPMVDKHMKKMFKMILETVEINFLLM